MQQYEGGTSTAPPSLTCRVVLLFKGQEGARGIAFVSVCHVPCVVTLTSVAVSRSFKYGFGDRGALALALARLVGLGAVAAVRLAARVCGVSVIARGASGVVVVAMLMVNCPSVTVTVLVMVSTGTR